MKRLAVIILAALLCVCCGKVRETGITSLNVSGVTPTSLRTVEATVELGVHNPSRQFSLTDINGTVFSDGEQVGTVVAEDVTVGARSDGQYSVHVTATLTGTKYRNLLQLMSIRSLDPFTLDASATLTRGRCGKKKLEYKDIPLKKLLNEYE